MARSALDLDQTRKLSGLALRNESAKSIAKYAGPASTISASAQEASVSRFYTDALWRSLLMELPEILWAGNSTTPVGSEQQNFASSCSTLR